MDADLATASACELARGVQRRDVSPVELIDGCLERIERIDGQLNSLVALAPERAREEARAARARAGTADARPFDGVPIAIKDLHCTRGLTTTFGTAAMADFVPDFDEEHVARLRRAGFVVVGKTNVPEWGTQPITEPRLHGPTRNPWDLQRSPGGSSGGAAAALAAGLVPVAQGSDGGGSIRIPASCCGVVGVKPSRGRVSLAPLLGDQLAGLVTPGPLTRHVEDATALLDVMRGYVTGDPYWAPEPERPYAAEPATEPGALRVGLITSAPLADFDADTTAAAESTARLLGDLGHAVEPVDTAKLGLSADVREQFATLWVCGIAALPLEPEQLEPFNAHHARTGHATAAPRLLQAVASLRLAARRIVAACQEYDVIVSPTLTRPPVPIGAFDGLEPEAAFAAAADYVGLAPLANLTGQPAISLPLAWAGSKEATAHADATGLPVGVMLTGRPADEATLLRLAGQAQRAVGWPAQHPAIAAR